MKISRTGGPAGTSGTSKAGSSSGRGSEFAKLLKGVSGTGTSVEVTGAAPVTAVDALLATQEVGDALSRQSRHKRARRRAEDLLERLDDIRHGLLIGSIPPDRLHDLARLLREHRDAVDDPALIEILDEIELRAQVELAKLDRRP